MHGYLGFETLVKLGPAQQSTYSPTSYLCCFCLKAIKKSSGVSIPQFAPSHYCPHYLEDCPSMTLAPWPYTTADLGRLFFLLSSWPFSRWLSLNGQPLVIGQIGHNRFSHFDMGERPQVCVVLTSCGPMVPRLPSPQPVIDTYYAPSMAKFPEH